MTYADHIAGSVRGGYQKLSVSWIRRALALLRNPPGKSKGKQMSWHMKKIGTRAAVLAFLRSMTIYRYPDKEGKDGNADQQQVVRDAAIDCVNALPAKFNCASIEASGHVDNTSGAYFTAKFEGLEIDLSMPAAPAAPEVAATAPEASAPAAQQEAGTTEAVAAPVVDRAAAP